jgi:acetyltransferase EpsM
MKKIVIWGAGGHALVLADAIRSGGQYEVAGFLVDAQYTSATRPSVASKILGGPEQMGAILADGIDLAVVGVGDCGKRLELAALLEAAGFCLATVVHPRAIIAAGVDLGVGTFIAAGAIVNPGVRIERNVIINTGAIIDHECRIGAGAHVSPGARLAGNVIIGQAAWIGIGATVVDDVAVGARTVIGAGAVVLADVPEGVVAYGVPAKTIKTKESSTKTSNEH